MLTALEPVAGARRVLVGRQLPNGTQVLVPQLVLPRTCRRLDGVMKIAFDNRAEAKAAKTKHEDVYRCPHCVAYHLASKQRHKQSGLADSNIRSRAA